MKKSMLFTEEMIRPDNDEFTDLELLGMYTAKLRHLEYTMNQLNLLDDPIEIRLLCRDIVKVKKKLKLLMAKRE